MFLSLSLRDTKSTLTRHGFILPSASSIVHTRILNENISISASCLTTFFLSSTPQPFKLSPKVVTCNFYILCLKYTKNKSTYTIISNSWEGITVHAYSIKLPQNDPLPIGNYFFSVSFPHCPLTPQPTLYCHISTSIFYRNSSRQELEISRSNGHDSP